MQGKKLPENSGFNFYDLTVSCSVVYFVYIMQRDGSTALIQACLCNHPEIVKVLLEREANVNLADKVHK